MKLVKSKTATSSRGCFARQLGLERLQQSSRPTAGLSRALDNVVDEWAKALDFARLGCRGRMNF